MNYDPRDLLKLFKRGASAPPTRIGGSQATKHNAAVDVGPARCDRKGHRGRKPGATDCSRCIGWQPYGNVPTQREDRLWLPSESVQRNSGLNPRSTS